MAVIYDPSKVTLAVSPGVGETREGTYGQTSITISTKQQCFGCDECRWIFTIQIGIPMVAFRMAL